MDEAASEQLSAYLVELQHYVNDCMAYLAIPRDTPGARQHIVMLFRNGHTWESACRTMKWYLRIK